MPSRRRELTTDDDPWKVSAFTSALLDLLLSFLLLLGAAIALITFQLVKYFGLDPPCTYIGCSHPLLPHSSKRRRCSVRCHRRAKVDRSSEIFPDGRNTWRYSKLQPQNEEFLSINEDTDESLVSEKSDSSSRHSAAVDSDLDILRGRQDEDHNGSYHNRNVNCIRSGSSSSIQRKLPLSKHSQPKAPVFNGESKRSAKEEYIPWFSTRAISACSSDCDVDKEPSQSSDDFKKPSLQKENLQREILTDNDASISRDIKHEHHYVLLKDDEPSQKKYVKRNAATFGKDGAESVREELVPLYSTRCGSVSGSRSDAEDGCQLSFTSTDDLKKAISQKEKLQRVKLIEDDASTCRETQHEHHYMLLNDEECGSDGMRSAKEENVLFFRRSVSVHGSDSDAEDDCEMSSISTDDFKKPDVHKESERRARADGITSISRDTEHEHQYMLLEDEDEDEDEKSSKDAVFDDIEGLSGDFEDEHHGMLSEGENKERATAPFFSNLQTESTQPLFDRISDSGLEAPKVSTRDLGDKVATVVAPPDIQRSGLGEGQNTGLLFIPLKMQATSQSLMDDESFDIWDKVHIDRGISADETSTGSIQGLENVNPGNPEGIMVEDRVGEEGSVNAELLEESPEVFSNGHDLDMGVDDAEGDAEGSLSAVELEYMLPKDLFNIHKVQKVTSFESGSQIALEDKLQAQEHEDEVESIPMKSFTADNDTCGTEINVHGEYAGKVSILSDLQQVQKYLLSNRSLDEGWSILDNGALKTEICNNGEAIPRALLEVVIHEAMDQYLINFKGCVSKDKCASSSDNIHVHVGQVELAKVNRRKELEKPCHDAAFQTVNSISKLEQGGLVLKESCRGVQENTLTSGSCNEESKIRQSLDVMEDEREKHETSSEQKGVQAQVMKAEQTKEDSLSEEDQEEGLNALRDALRAERITLEALEMELENERNAAAIATSEAMAMIARLQEEKSAMQMEVVHLQRMSEEKADYDEQAMELLKEILLKREKEKHALEKEVELYRERFLSEKIDVFKKSNVDKSNKDASMPTSTPVLLLRGTDKDHDTLSTEGKNDKLKSLPSLEAFYDAEITPHVTSKNTACREHFGFIPQPIELKETELSRIDQVGACFQENKGNLAEPFVNRLHNIHQEPRGTSGSIFSTNDEETQFILERLWVLEEELRELRGEEDGLGASSDAQHGDGSSMKRKCDRSIADSCDARCIDGGMGEHKVEDGAGMFLPIHDVYEVQSTPHHRGQGILQSGTSECLSGATPKDFESFPRDISQEYLAASRHNHRPQNIPQARILFPSRETHCDTALALNEDHPGADDTLLKATGGRLVTTEVVQQLAVRLQVLETDKQLLREILESFRHRDAELTLLQEIARHLRELQMVGPGRAGPGGVLQGPFLPTAVDQSCASVLKKRRYCSGPGQTQTLLLQQKSI